MLFNLRKGTREGIKRRGANKGTRKEGIRVEEIMGGIEGTSQPTRIKTRTEETRSRREKNPHRDMSRREKNLNRDM